MWLGRGWRYCSFTPWGNRASTEWLFQGACRKRENRREGKRVREKGREIQRKEARETEKESLWSVQENFFFLQREEIIPCLRVRAAGSEG